MQPNKSFLDILVEISLIIPALALLILAVTIGVVHKKSSAALVRNFAIIGSSTLFGIVTFKKFADGTLNTPMNLSTTAKIIVIAIFIPVSAAMAYLGFYIANNYNDAPADQAPLEAPIAPEAPVAPAEAPAAPAAN
jgi:hypothetical protein